MSKEIKSGSALRSSPQRTMTEKYRDLQLYKWKCENEKMEKSDALNDFENYIMSEYELKNPIKIKYTHNINVKSTKGKILENHIVTMILNYYNDMDSCKTYIRFINNSIDPRYKTKKINPGELKNKFMAAKNDIINIIKAEYEEKRNELDEKINELDEKINQLNEFGKGQFGIEDQFRGELVKVRESSQSPKNKKSYDM